MIPFVNERRASFTEGSNDWLNIEAGDMGKLNTEDDMIIHFCTSFG